MTTGYSGTPLVKKLGIKEGFVVLGVNPPDKIDVVHFYSGLVDQRNWIKLD
jgi:hypothetical protein